MWWSQKKLSSWVCFNKDALSGKTFPFSILESKCRPAHTEGRGCTSAQTEMNINPERCSCCWCFICPICSCNVLRSAWMSLWPSPSSRSRNKITFQQNPTRTEYVFEHAPVLQSGTSQAPKQLLMTFFFFSCLVFSRRKRTLSFEICHKVK